MSTAGLLFTLDSPLVSAVGLSNGAAHIAQSVTIFGLNFRGPEYSPTMSVGAAHLAHSVTIFGLNFHGPEYNPTTRMAWAVCATTAWVSSTQLSCSAHPDSFHPHIRPRTTVTISGHANVGSHHSHHSHAPPQQGRDPGTGRFNPSFDPPTTLSINQARAAQLRQAELAAMSRGIGEGVRRYAQVVQEALRHASLDVLALGERLYSALRRRLSSRLDARIEGHLGTAALPPYADALALRAQSIAATPFRYSYGHRALQCKAAQKRQRGCLGTSCANDGAASCAHHLCAQCCDKRFGASVCEANPMGEVCPCHQPDGQPRTLGCHLFDQYTAQVEDPVAFLSDFLNGEGAKLLSPKLSGGVVEVEGTLWVDGGRSCGAAACVHVCLPVAAIWPVHWQRCSAMVLCAQ